MVLAILSTDPVLVQLSGGNLRSYYLSYLMLECQEAPVVEGNFASLAFKMHFLGKNS